MNLLHFFRHENETNRRLQPRRRPIVEVLDGRQLQSGIVGKHIGTMVTPAVVGNHIGYEMVTPAVVGAHIGSNVV